MKVTDESQWDNMRETEKRDQTLGFPFLMMFFFFFFPSIKSRKWIEGRLVKVKQASLPGGGSFSLQSG